MKKPFKKNLSDISIEDAHGGSGRRQLILFKEDEISTKLKGMTKGFLTPGEVFDWHSHDEIDEFFLVLQGTGVIFFKDGTTFEYAPDDIIYIPANFKHRIEARGSDENQYYFIRISS